MRSARSDREARSGQDSRSHRDRKQAEGGLAGGVQYLITLIGRRVTLEPGDHIGVQAERQLLLDGPIEQATLGAQRRSLVDPRVPKASIKPRTTAQYHPTMTSSGTPRAAAMALSEVAEPVFLPASMCCPQWIRGRARRSAFAVCEIYESSAGKSRGSTRAMIIAGPLNVFTAASAASSAAAVSTS